MMKKLLKIAGVAGIIGLIVLGFIFFSGDQDKKDVEAETVQAPAEAADINLTIDAFGVIKATDTQNIMIDFPANVTKVWVREGQHVSLGDPLLTLDISEYLTDIHNRETNLETEKRNYHTRRTYQSSNTDPELNRLVVELKTAENFYQQDLKQLANRETLLKAGAISQNDYDEFKKSVDNRKQTVDSLRLSIENLRFNKDTETDRQWDTVSSISSDLQIMKSRLAKSYLKGNKIVSNMNGVVYDLNCVPGDRLGKGDQLVKTLSLLNLDSLIVVADVEEEFIKEIKLGAPVTVRLLADKSHSYQGNIIRIAARAVVKNNVTYIPVEISLSNMDEYIRPEMNVDVKISRSQK